MIEDAPFGVGRKNKPHVFSRQEKRLVFNRSSGFQRVHNWATKEIRPPYQKRMEKNDQASKYQVFSTKAVKFLIELQAITAKLRSTGLRLLLQEFYEENVSRKDAKCCRVFMSFLCTFAPLRENTCFTHGPETEFQGFFVQGRHKRQNNKELRRSF